MMNVKELCQICAYERVKKTMVACPKCKFLCCRGCVKKFLLDSSSQIPTCMNCKVGWDLDFISCNTDDSFHDEYRLHRAKIILSLEKSLLPSTQEDVNKEIKKRDHEEFLRESRVYIRNINKWIKEAKVKMTTYLEKYSKYFYEDNDEEEASRYYKKWLKKMEQISRCELDKKEVQYRITNELIKVEVEERKHQMKPEMKKEKKINYIGPCPQDECKGYLDEKYKCGLCESKVCKKCMLPDHDDECNKDLVETVKMLKKETKPCPKCKAPIFKIDGCDQIWCTSCHTAFSWNTGEIESGKIHNPHYYQWMRENGELKREQGDVVCGGEVDYQVLMNKVKRIYDRSKIREYLTNVHRMIRHIREVSLPNHYPITDRPDSNKDLRIRYMIGDFDEKRWLSNLKAKEKIREKNRAMNLLLTMCANVMEDLIRSISICESKKEFDNFMLELSELNKYANSNIGNLEKRFKIKIGRFEELWDFGK